MREKIKHLIALKLIEKGKTKMSLRQLIQSGGAADEKLNLLLDNIKNLEEEIQILERVLKQLK